jgi:hypothetical protein
MRSVVRLVSVLPIVALAAIPMRAQTAKRTPLPLVEIAPYAGYLVASDLLTGALGTRVSTGGSAMYGAQLSVPINRYVAAVGNVAYAKGDLSIGIPIIGGVDVGQAATWLYDGGLQVSAPAMTRGHGALVPFAQLGVGAVRRAIDVDVVTTRATNLAWNVGAGVDFALGPAIALRVLAKDYVGKFDVSEAAGIDAGAKVTHSWALTAGLKLAF